MKTMNKVLAVSMIAMLAVPAAHAKIVAETMLTNDAGHYSSTHTVQSEINAKQDTLTTAQLNAVNSGITSDKVSTYDGYATGKQDTLVTTGTGQNIQGAGSVTVTKANGMITISGAETDISGKQDKLNSGTGGNVVAGTATGNVVTSITASNGTVTVNKASGAIKNVDIASDAAIAKTKLASDVQASLDKADTALQSHQDISGKEDKLSKSTSSTAVADSTDNTKKDVNYPTVAGAKAIADAAVSTASGNYATAAQGAKADTALQTVTANDGAGVVTNISKNGTAVTMTKAKIANADVADNAAIDQSKINGLSTSLSGKVNVAQGSTNKDKVLITNATSGDVETTAFIHATGGSYTAGGEDNDKYIPSVELVENIALTAAGTPVQLNQGSNNANKAVITGNDGVVTTGQIATGMIANKAVTNDKLSDAVNASLNLADSAVQPAAISDMETKTHAASTYQAKALVTNLTSADDTHYPSAKAVSDAITSVQTSANGKVSSTGHTKNRTLSVKSDGTVVDGTVSGSDGVSASVDDSGNIAIAGTAATSNAFGVVKTGTNITNSSGTISVENAGVSTKGVVQLASGSTNTTAENVSNKVTSVASASTDTQYPSAKAVYTAVEAAKTANTTAINNLDYSGATGGNVITQVTQTNGAVTASMGKVLDTVSTDGTGNVVTAVAENEDGTTIDVTKGMTAIPEPTATNTSGTLVLTATPKSGGGYTYQWEDLGR